MSTPLPLPTGIRSHLPDLFARMYNPFSQDPQAQDALDFTVEPSQAHASLEISGATATLHLSRPAVIKTAPVYFPDITHPVSPSFLRYDLFDRPNTESGWGLATDATTTWTPEFGADPISTVIFDHEGFLNPEAQTVFFGADDLTTDDLHILMRFRFWQTNADLWLLTRHVRGVEVGFFTDFFHGVEFEMHINDGGWVDPRMEIVQARTYLPFSTGFHINLGQKYWLRFQAQGRVYSWKLWSDADAEPINWTYSYTAGSDVYPSVHLDGTANLDPIGGAKGIGLYGDKFGGDGDIWSVDRFYVLDSNPTPDIDTFHWVPFIENTVPWSAETHYSPGDYVYDIDGTVFKCIKVPDTSTHLLAEDTFHRPNETNGWGISSSGRHWLPVSDDFAACLSIVANKGLIQYDGSGNLPARPNAVQFGNSPVASTGAHDIVVQWYYTQHDGSVGSYNVAWELNMNTEDIIGEDLDYPNFLAPSLDGIDDTGGRELDIQGYGHDTYPYERLDANILTNNVVYNTRLRANKPFFGVRTWVDGTTEPDTWDFSTSTDGFILNPIDRHFTSITPFNHSSQANQQIFFKRFSVYSIVNPEPSNDPVHWSPIYSWSPFEAYPEPTTVTFDFTGTTGLVHEDDFHRANDPSSWGTDWTLTNAPDEHGTAHIASNTGYLVSDSSFDTAVMIWNPANMNPINFVLQAEFLIPDDESQISFLVAIDDENPLGSGDSIHIAANDPYDPGFYNIYWSRGSVPGSFVAGVSAQVLVNEPYTVHVYWDQVAFAYIWRLVRNFDSSEVSNSYNPSSYFGGGAPGPSETGFGVRATTALSGQNVQLRDIQLLGPVPVMTTLYKLYDQPVPPNITPDTFDNSVIITQDVSFNLANSPDSDNQPAIPSIGHLAPITRDAHLVTLPSLEDFLRSTGDRFFNTDLITWTVSVPPDSIKPLAALSLIDGTYA